MSADYLYGKRPKVTAAKTTSKAARPTDPRGKPVNGKIVKILVGQGHGFIRLSDKREVYFHRADLSEGTAFNDLQPGDAVTGELLEDAISGARAVRVARKRR